MRFSRHRSIVILALAVPFFAAILATPSALRAQGGEGRYPLAPATVAAALEKAGLPLTLAQLDLPGALSATSATPELRVTNAELLADGRMRVRLACRERGQCQPFLATVALHATDNPLAGVASLNASLHEAPTALSGRGPGLQAGQHVTLLMEDEHMRIALPVIAIDSGKAGAEVRVSSPDRKKTFRGIVAGDGVVRGYLP